MRITYKFKSGSTEDFIECEGHEISAAEAKRRLVEKHHLKSEDYSLLLFTANDEEITDAEFIADGTFLTLRRVPSSHTSNSHSARSNPEINHLGSAVLDVDSDPYATMVSHTSESAASTTKSLAESALSSPVGQKPAAGTDRSNVSGPRVPTCFHCGEPGHRINECPTNPNAAHYRNRFNQQKTKPKEPEDDIPQSMKCRLCRNLFVDPVIVSCCGDTFCSQCFQEAVKRNDYRCPNVQCREKVEPVGHTFPNSRIRDLVADYRTKNNLPTLLSRNNDPPSGLGKAESSITLPALAVPKPDDTSKDEAIKEQEPRSPDPPDVSSQAESSAASVGERSKEVTSASTPEKGEARLLEKGRLGKLTKRSGDPPDIPPKRLASASVLSDSAVLSREEFDRLKAIQMKNKGQMQMRATTPEREPPPLRQKTTKPTVPGGPLAAPAGPRRRYTGEYVVRSFPFISHVESRGIVHFVGHDNSKGEWINPVDSKELRVCASSMNKAVSGGLQAILDHQHQTSACFHTEDAPYSWIILDFGERSVRPSVYTLGVRSPTDFFLRSWQFEGSDDNTQWTILSRHDNDDSLYRHRRFASWAVKTSSFFRYFRLVLDPHGNSIGTSALALNSLELYGELKSPPSGYANAYCNQQLLQNPLGSLNSLASLTSSTLSNPAQVMLGGNIPMSLGATTGCSLGLLGANSSPGLQLDMMSAINPSLGLGFNTSSGFGAAGQLGMGGMGLQGLLNLGAGSGALGLNQTPGHVLQTLPLRHYTALNPRPAGYFL